VVTSGGSGSAAEGPAFVAGNGLRQGAFGVSISKKGNKNGGSTGKIYQTMMTRAAENLRKLVQIINDVDITMYFLIFQ